MHYKKYSKTFSKINGIKRNFCENLECATGWRKLKQNHLIDAFSRLVSSSFNPKTHYAKGCVFTWWRKQHKNNFITKIAKTHRKTRTIIFYQTNIDAFKIAFLINSKIKTKLFLRKNYKFYINLKTIYLKKMIPSLSECVEGWNILIYYQINLSIFIN